MIRIQSMLSDSKLDTEHLVERFEVQHQTVDRWLKTQKYPSHVREYLQLRSGNYPGWQGFKIRPGEIVTPGGDVVTSHQVQNYYVVSGMLHRELKISRSMQEKAERTENRVRQSLYDGAKRIIRELEDHLQPELEKSGERAVLAAKDDDRKGGGGSGQSRHALLD